MKRAAVRKSMLQVDDIEVEVQRKSVRYLRLSVGDTGTHARVSAPRWISNAAVREFVHSNRDWIRQRLRTRSEFYHRPVEYHSGEELRVFGRKRKIELVVQRGRPAMTLCGEDGVWLRVPPDSNREGRERLVNSWYRQELARRIPMLVARWEPEMGVDVAEWRIRRMRTRWGSCNIQARRIWLNLELARWPPECLEYVVVHEMVHLLERGHNARFRGFMDRFLPGWRGIQATLAQGS